MRNWAVGPATEGFDLLLENDLFELTAEYLVVKYASEFSSEVVEAARSRLTDAGVDPEGLKATIGSQKSPMGGKSNGL